MGKNLPAGGIREVVIWITLIAVFRGRDARVRALANRRARCQLKLTLGQVEGCELVRAYHGWTYDGGGRSCAFTRPVAGFPS